MPFNIFNILYLLLMEWESVDSTSIAAIGYDKEKGTLGVRFRKTGKTYYYKVSPDTHKAFMSSQSKGSFFLDSIRDFFPAHEVPW